MYVSEYFQILVSGKLSRQGPLSQESHTEAIPFLCAVLSLSFLSFFLLLFFFNGSMLFYHVFYHVFVFVLEFPE